MESVQLYYYHFINNNISNVQYAVSITSGNSELATGQMVFY